jgi:Flp pilus assembly protein TadB
MSGTQAAGLPGAGTALAAAAAHPVSAAMAQRWPWSLIALLAGVFATLLIGALLVTGSLSRGEKNRDLLGRIERYGPRHIPAPADARERAARNAVGWAARLLRSTNAEPGLARRLELAGIARAPAEWVLLGGVAGLLVSAAVIVLADNIVVGILVGVLASWLGMRLSLSVRIARRQAAFSDQLPDMLQLIAGSLKGGFSLAQALGSVVREDTQPAADEFSRALAEARVGVDLEVALQGVANRMESEDLRWTVMAIRIQREVGGNLAEVLGTTVGTMRERAYLYRHVRALSAEGRLSAYILTALPVLVGGWLMFSDRTYIRPLYTTSLGLLMLAGAAVLFVIGAVWMRVLIKVEV